MKIVKKDNIRNIKTLIGYIFTLLLQKEVNVKNVFCPYPHLPDTPKFHTHLVAATQNISFTSHSKPLTEYFGQSDQLMIFRDARVNFQSAIWVNLERAWVDKRLGVWRKGSLKYTALPRRTAGRPNRQRRTDNHHCLITLSLFCTCIISLCKVYFCCSMKITLCVSA